MRYRLLSIAVKLVIMTLVGLNNLLYNRDHVFRRKNK